MFSHCAPKFPLAAIIAATLLFLANFARADLTIYDDELAPGWQNWSWATVDMASTATAYTGSNSVAVTAGAWTALAMRLVNTPIDTSTYGKLSFWANGGPSGGQTLRISALLTGTAQPAIVVGPLVANTWTRYEIDLASLGAANSSAFNGVWFQEGTGNAQPVFYIDEVTLVTGVETPRPLEIDGLGLFDDGFVNGWQNWSWATVSTNTTVTNSGAASIAVTSGPGQALYFHHSSFSSQGYSDLIFYINGGPVGGQSLKVQALLNDVAQSQTIVLPPLVANTWTKIVIPLVNLGIFNKPDLTGIWFQEAAGVSQPVYYVDDAYLQAAPPPSTINVSVNAATTVQTVDPRIFGLNTAIWDSVLNTATTAELLSAIDIQALRFPGGSASDVYHWETNMSEGQTFTWASDFDDFANIAVTTGSQAYITVNYGTGTPEEAARWVRYSNVTNNFGFKYWEVGNENYGTWEADNNDRPWDGATYARRFKIYMEQMKAVDPTIKVGAVIEASEDISAHYPETVTNPRTGAAHSGFSAVMLATFKEIGVTPDYVVYHRYEQGPGGESDSYLLNASTGWKASAQQIRQMLNDYLGEAAAGVEINCTENNSVYSNPGKQTTSLVNGLFLADSIGNILQTEFKSLIFWDLRNGQEAGNNNLDTVYGWRSYGDYGIMSSANPAGPADLYPTYYVYKLLTHFARGGERVVSAASDYTALGVYATRTNDSVRVLLINKSPKFALNASVTLDAFSPATQAQTFSYGIPQDEAARTGTGSADIASDSMLIPGKTFTYSAAPYSATVITLPLDPATSLNIQRSGFSLNRRTNRIVQTITLKNTGTSAVTGPVYLALDGLSANTRLANAAGMTSRITPTGSPYVLVSNSSIAAGASVTAVLEFMPPSSGSVSYTTSRAVVVTGAP